MHKGALARTWTRLGIDGAILAGLTLLLATPPALLSVLERDLGVKGAPDRLRLLHEIRVLGLAAKS